MSRKWILEFFHNLLFKIRDNFIVCMNCLWVSIFSVSDKFRAKLDQPTHTPNPHHPSPQHYKISAFFFGLFSSWFSSLFRKIGPYFQKYLVVEFKITQKKSCLNFQSIPKVYNGKTFVQIDFWKKYIKIYLYLNLVIDPIQSIAYIIHFWLRKLRSENSYSFIIYILAIQIKVHK